VEDQIRRQALRVGQFLAALAQGRSQPRVFLGNRSRRRALADPYRTRRIFEQAQRHVAAANNGRLHVDSKYERPYRASSARR